MSNPYWSDIATALELRIAAFTETGQGDLPSIYAVSDFASATIGAAGVALAELTGNSADNIEIDRRLASLWFDMTLRAQGWELPSIWDPIAGVYATTDGFIRLHTNAPHHRDAALGVLGCANDRDAVTATVAKWNAEALETAIVAAKGCAARQRSADEWQGHPQGIAVRAEPLVRWHDTGSCLPKPLIDTSGPPLAGLRVLDLTRVLAGPVASRFLAGFGAEVLRIDPPHWNEPAAEAEATLGKHCAGLDLHQPEDREIFAHLLCTADVFLHGYRPGALEHLGFGAAERADLNLALIDVSLSAYGRSGPWAGRRGFDSLVQMSCGITAQSARATGSNAPLPLPVQALDHGTGYLMAAAVLKGLSHRQQGKICRAELSLARTAQCLMSAAGAISPLANITAKDGDYAPEIEQTSWGPARRLMPPLVAAGLAPEWQTPAGRLRRHPARWQE